MNRLTNVPLASGISQRNCTIWPTVKSNCPRDSTAQPSPTTPSITISITATGTNTVGKTYSMECSATVTGSTDQPTITWLHYGDEISPTDHTRMVSPPTLRSSGDYSSTLTFNPLLTSHAGTYTCTAMVRSVVETAAVTITVQSECSLQVLMFV